MHIDFGSLSLREKVLQTFVVTMREINKHGGPEKFFEHYPVGGMYYAEGPKDHPVPETGTHLSRERLALCRQCSRLPLLVCADETIARGQNYWLNLDTVSAIDTEEAAYAYGKIVGMQMNDHDVDWVLGPIADMLIEPTMPLFGWCEDAQTTARMTGAIIRGIQDQGVCATIKHFPGNGTSNLNMHFGPGVNNMDFPTWMESFGHIYRNAVSEDVLSVMSTHVTLESYDNEIHDGYYPIATYSKKLTEDLLKGTLGFRGAVVTDALVMGGSAGGDIVEETAQAFRCGADLLLFPPVEAADRIVELLQSGEIPMSRLEDALQRIGRMRAFRGHALENHTMDVPSPQYINAVNDRLAAAGMCLLRNEKGLIPLSADTLRNILIIDATDSGRDASLLLQEELQKRGFTADVRRDIYDTTSMICWQEDLQAMAADYDLVIINIHMDYTTAWSTQCMLIWGTHLFRTENKIIINYGSPLFAPTYLPQEPTFIEVNSAPNRHTIPILVDKLLGESPFIGKNRRKRSMSAIHAGSQKQEQPDFISNFLHF